MTAYIIRRLLFVIPTLFVILLANFVFIQFAPGGPVELAIARIQGTAVDATARVSGGGGEQGQASQGRPGGQSNSQYRGARGLDPKLIQELEKQFGFDKPAHERFVLMVRDYLKFDFGQSFYQNRSVIDLVVEKMPVSISIGVWTTLLVYLISIPLGIMKAVRDGSSFDVWTSVIVIIGNAIPSFLFAVLLVVLFAGGSFFNIFPLRGLVSPDWHDLNIFMKIVDYLWHMVLPISAMVIGGFASLTILTKNSFLEEINKQYVLTARSKGLEEKHILYGHIFRNAMLIVIAGFPSAFIGILFGSSLLIELIFSLDGLGLLGFEAVVNRDYPVVFATLYIFTLLGLLMNILGDIMYHVVDPRIDFEARKV
ncbi:MAG: microcin transporter permease [Rhodospirillales bacterium]|jgi:microcin C transport system permease protein|nr:microcin transporter permease [Rhodospirillales bacterium]